MTYLLCRNRVLDYARWRTVFEAQNADARSGALRLVSLWRGVEEPADVFFLFEVESVEAAEAFMNAPESAVAGEAAGVVEGEFHFVEEIGES